MSAGGTSRILAPPGQYDFRRAIIRSSNTYFITDGLRAGIENIVRMGEKFHLGERTDLPTRQETKGIFPTLARVHSDWRDGDTANLCIGQGEIAVTPMQMAVGLRSHRQRRQSALAAARRAHRTARSGVRRSADYFSFGRRA